MGHRQYVVARDLAIMEQFFQNIFGFDQYMHIMAIILPVLDGILIQMEVCRVAQLN